MAALLTNKILITVAAIFIVIEVVSAANYTVGGGVNGGWSIGTNLSNWVSTISFKTGDNLLFKYDKSEHDVVEVSKSKYDSCSTVGPIKTYTSGDDVITLSTAVSRYFICGVPSHCSLGMKLQIDIGASTSDTSPPPESGTPGGPTPPSAAVGRILEGKAAAAGLIVVGVLMMLLAL